MAGRMLRRRGQATAEFTLVFPLFIAVLGGLLLLAMVATNVSSAEAAARAGLRGGAWAMNSVNRQMALHPIISTVSSSKLNSSTWIGSTMVDPVSKSKYGTAVVAAFFTRNKYDAKGLYRSRIGWDWGLIDTANTRTKIRAVLSGAIARTQEAIANSIAVGTGPSLYIRACFLASAADFCPDSASGTAMLVAQAQDLSGSVSFPGENVFWAASSAANAPRFLRVDVFLVQSSWLGFVNNPEGWAWRASAVDRLPRFEPACPNPLTIAEQRLDPCGAAYSPWAP